MIVARDSHYTEALPRYLKAFDAAFTRARERSEFEFIQCLLRVRGEQDPGWDPYEATLRATGSLVSVLRGTADVEAARHLQLRIYGHIVEASEPYELLANLIDVARGGEYVVDRFARGETAAAAGGPHGPGRRIAKIREAAVAAGIPEVAEPLGEFWNRELRNAVLHGDYAFHGRELRILHPMRTYTYEDELRFAGRALAYHDALASLDHAYILGYDRPLQIAVSIEFSEDPDERATVMVKDGHGVVGLKDSWTREELAAGRTPWLMARLTPEDARLLREDPTRARFPAEQKKESTRGTSSS